MNKASVEASEVKDILMRDKEFKIEYEKLKSEHKDLSQKVSEES